jgi:O-antigen/teichoic acid export membrane protein
MKLAHAFSTSLLWRGIYFLSVLLLNILISRHFNADGSGQIFYVTSVVAFFVIVISFCLEVPMGYYLSKKKISETRVSISAIIWWLLTAPITYLVILAVSALDQRFERSDIVFPAFAFLSGNILVTFFVAMFYSRLDFALPNIILVIVNIVLIAVIPNNSFVGQFMSDAGYVNVYFSSFFFQGFFLIVAFLAKYFKRKDWGIVPFHLFRSFFYFAFLAFITNVLSFLMYRIDYLFVNRYCSSSDLGNYIQACKLAQLFFIVPAILASVIFPITASGQNNEINLKMQIVSRGMVLGYAIVLVFLSRFFC